MNFIAFGTATAEVVNPWACGAQAEPERAAPVSAAKALTSEKVDEGLVSGGRQPGRLRAASATVPKSEREGIACDGLDAVGDLGLPPVAVAALLDIGTVIASRGKGKGEQLHGLGSRWPGSQPAEAARGGACAWATVGCALLLKSRLVPPGAPALADCIVLAAEQAGGRQVGRGSLQKVEQTDFGTSRRPQKCKQNRARREAARHRVFGQAGLRKLDDAHEPRD